MTFPSNKKPICQDHEEIELVLSLTDKYGIEHEHIQSVCLNCTDQITFQTSDLRTPDIDVDTLALLIKSLQSQSPFEKDKTVDIGRAQRKDGFNKAIDILNKIRIDIEHPGLRND